MMRCLLIKPKGETPEICTCTRLGLALGGLGLPTTGGDLISLVSYEITNSGVILMREVVSVACGLYYYAAMHAQIWTIKKPAPEQLRRLDLVG